MKTEVKSVKQKKPINSKIGDKGVVQSCGKLDERVSLEKLLQ